MKNRAKSFLLHKLLTFFTGILLLTVYPVTDIYAESFHSAWSELLAKHVEEGLVDYVGFKTDEDRLDKYLAFLDSVDPQTLSPEEQLSLYINAYNSYTVKLILDHFSDGKPVKSIKNIGGFFSGPWKIRFCRIGGNLYSLDNIEHDIIRPVFDDPRVHFAVNCASKSCPPLLSRAYEAEDLEEQLERNAYAFINNPKFNYVEDSTLYVSKIFKWFSEDFGSDVRGYIKKYAKGDIKAALEKMGESMSLKYLDYDWSLNSKHE